MPPKAKGEFPLKLSDGREFALTFNHETLFAAEAAFGQPMHILLDQLRRDMWGAVRAFMFASIKPRHPEITLEQCGEILLSGSIVNVGSAIMSGIAQTMPVPEEGKKGKNPPLPGPAGMNSGDSGAKRASSQKGSGKQRRARSR